MTMPQEVAQEVAELVFEGYYLQPTGSRVTKSGWKPESDWDFVVLDKDETLQKRLRKDMRWIEDGSGNKESIFSSFKQAFGHSVALPPTQINFILVKDKETFGKYKVASELIRVMDCKAKEERVKVFDTIFQAEDKGVPF
jgi:hypothetical protein